VSALGPDENTIRETWRWLAHGAHGVSEVRVIRPAGGIVGIGFFDDEEAFVRECVRTNAAGNVYVGIQPRPRRLFEMAPNVVRPLKTGAGRKDIEVLTATVIDLDPVRPKDTASTDAELALAMAAAEIASAWCDSEGLARPRLMMSGNGAQLWFALPPTPLEGDRRERLQAGLKAFETKARERAQTDAVHVDSIHDVARIIKVIGTVSHKGSGQGDRPHRVSSALSGFDRVEDAALLERLDVEPERTLPVQPRVSLPVVGNQPAPGTAKAKCTPEGGYDWQHPVPMCAPIQHLWDHGAESDRSGAIMDMVRLFAHEGLSLDEITDLIIEWDRRGEHMGKLAGRDGPAYVRKTYEKVLAAAGADGVQMPCKSLQTKHQLCKVNVEPGVRCDRWDALFDIDGRIEAIPADTAALDLEVKLKPILQLIAARDPAVQSKYLGLVERRFGLKAKDLRKSVAKVTSAPASADGFEAEPEELDGAIHEDASCYYCLTPRGETRILSSFTIEPTMRVETEEGELILGYANTDKSGRVPNLRFPLGAFHSKRDLIRHLPSADLQWTGSDNNVQGLLRVLAKKDVPRRAGTTMLGEYKRGEHHLWLGPGCAIGKEGFIEKPPVVYVPSGASLDKKVRYEPCADEAFHEVARVVFEDLPRANTPKVMLPMIGWFFATPMKPRFMAKVGSFPLLFVWGTQGSGKSSILMEVLWPLFGIEAAEPYSATETEFAMIKTLTSTTSIPVFMDEYKPSDMQRNRLNTLHRFLRRLFRGESEERGRPDLKVNTYHLQAPLCLAGETRPSEGAILERLVTANPLKTTLERGSFKCHFQTLKTVKLQRFAPRYIQFCLGRDFDSDLANARRITEKLLCARKAPPLRVVENVTAMVLGVHLFEEFAAECGFDLPGDLGVEEAVNAVLDDVVETDHGVKNALDHFLEMLGVMAVQRILKPGIHYALVGGDLALHLESAYDAFRAHAKRIDYDRELVDLKAMRRMVMESRLQGGCVVDESKKVSFGGEARRRAVIIDFAKTHGALSADDFPTEESGGGFKERYAGGGWHDS
jgi:hypothetical protein